MRNLWNSVLLSTASVLVSLRPRRAGGLCLRALQVPARRGHRLHAAVLPLRAAAARAAAAVASISRTSASTNTYIGLIWVYQLICLPLILWIVRGYFEDISPDIEHAYRIDGHSLVADLPQASPSRWPGRASRRRACSPSSSPGTTSSSR